MKIGIVTGEYPPMQGGVGDFTRELAAALAQQSHKVHVITRSVGKAQTQLFQVHPAIPHWGWECHRQIVNLARYLRLDVLNVQYQAAAYDLRPAINFLTWVLNPHVPLFRHKELAKLALVVTYHDLKSPYLFPKAGPLRDWVVTLLARRADAVIATNRADELELKRRQIKRVARIPIGSNIKPALPANYERDAWRARFGVNARDVLLGYFGFLNETKGADTLVQALARLDEHIHLLFIGGMVGSSDPSNQAFATHIEDLIERLGLQERVHRTGYVPAKDVSAAFAAADLCVLPYTEGISFHHGTLMAAIAHSRPVISTQPQVALPELQPGENVCLVPPRDPAALAAAITELVTDTQRRERLAHGAGALSQQFTWERIAAQSVELFECIKQKK